MLKKIIIVFTYQFYLFFLSKLDIKNSKKIKYIKKKIKNKKVYLLDFSSIGSSILLSCYLNRLLSEKKLYKNNLIIISNKTKLNSFWQNKLKQKFFFKECPNLFKFLKRYSNNFKLNIINWPFDGTNFETENSLILEFDDEEKLLGDSLLKKLKIDKNKKIVTISYKSNDYWLKKINKYKSFEEYRLSKPENLIKSVEFLKKNNYQIIFTGEPSSNDKKILSNCIFYDHLEQKEKNFFDFYIYYVANFSIIGQSGDLAFAYLFKKPILNHNAIHPNFFNKGIFLPKYFYNNSKTKYLNFEKILKIKKYHYFSDIIFPKLKKISAIHFKNTFYFSSKDITLIENNNEDILEGVKELIEYIDNRFYEKLSNNDRILQKNIKEKFYFNSITKNDLLINTMEFNGYVSQNYLNKLKKLNK